MTSDGESVEMSDSDTLTDSRSEENFEFEISLDLAWTLAEMAGRPLQPSDEEESSEEMEIYPEIDPLSVSPNTSPVEDPNEEPNENENPMDQWNPGLFSNGGFYSDESSDELMDASTTATILSIMGPDMPQLGIPSIPEFSEPDQGTSSNIITWAMENANIVLNDMLEHDFDDGEILEGGAASQIQPLISVPTLENMGRNQTAPDSTSARVIPWIQLLPRTRPIQRRRDALMRAGNNVQGEEPQHAQPTAPPIAPPAQDNTGAELAASRAERRAELQASRLNARNELRLQRAQERAVPQRPYASDASDSDTEDSDNDRNEVSVVDSTSGPVLNPPWDAGDSVQVPGPHGWETFEDSGAEEAKTDEE